MIAEFATERSALPYRRVYLEDDEDPTREGASLQFRLLYEGDLFASANGSSHIKNKHAIRKTFHSQLRRQWERHLGLRGYAVHVGNSGDPNTTDDDRFKDGLLAIGRNWSRAGYECVPVVTKDFPVHCVIDITLLRPGDDKHISKQGDIDGQVKTILDALRIPEDLKETGNSVPEVDETPFFCLLSDDKLITTLRVEADELLMLPNHKEIKATEAFVIVRVKIDAKMVGSIGNYF